MTILVWNFDTQRTQSLTVNLELTGKGEHLVDHSFISIFPEHNLDSIGIFYYSVDNGFHYDCRYLRCLKSGSLITSKRYRLEAELDLWDSSCQPCGHGKFFMHQTFTSDRNTGKPSTPGALVLDLNRDELQVTEFDVMEPDLAFGSDGMLIWENVAYLNLVQGCSEHDTRWVIPQIRVDTSRSYSQPRGYPRLEPTFERPIVVRYLENLAPDGGRHQDYARFAFHGNESMVVIQVRDGISVYSFDPDLDFRDAAAALGVDEYEGGDIFDENRIRT